MQSGAVLGRATFRLGLACDNRCIFCGQDGLHDAKAPVGMLDPSASDGELTFIGGEPTLHPGLVQSVEQARRAGFTRIGLQTNGRRLGEPGLAAALAGAGLTDVHVTVLGAEPAVHDYHTGVSGSFEQLLAGVGAARRHGLTVAATTVVTRSNFRVLSPLPVLLRSREVAAWLLTLPSFAGRAASGFDRVVPRLGLALPFALHALEGARRLALPAWVQGAPLCALGPFAARALPTFATAAFGRACEGCEARPSCPGVDPTYLARFGEEELSARDAAPAAPLSLAEAALARMFVGAGELFVPVPARIEPPPAAVREALPQLGKVRPAARELIPGAPKKSGEALKEIFPQLFGEAPEKPPAKPG